MVAAVARDEPHMAPKPAHAPTAAIATPPRLCPRQAPANRNRDSLIPALDAKFPISKNKGITVNE